MDADELKLQFATILNLLTIIASAIVLFVTKQTTAYWRVYDDCAGRLGYSIAEMKAQLFVADTQKTLVLNRIFESFATISVV